MVPSYPISLGNLNVSLCYELHKPPPTQERPKVAGENTPLSNSRFLHCQIRPFGHVTLPADAYGVVTGQALSNPPGGKEG